jgi:hypothetical protein
MSLTGSAHSKHLTALLAAISCIPLLYADEHKIDPTFLYRDTSAVKASNSDLTTPGCHYKPLFGQGDSDTSIVVGVARYGEAVLDPHGACATVQYPGEDQVYIVLDGKGTVNYGNEIVPLDKEDYLYLPATVPHTLRNGSGSPLVVVVMGFRTQGFEKSQPPSHPLKANIEDVPTGLVSGHPSSTLYRLLRSGRNVYAQNRQHHRRGTPNRFRHQPFRHHCSDTFASPAAQEKRRRPYRESI